MLYRTKTYFKYIKLLNYSKYLTCIRVPTVDISQFLTLKSISLFSETSSIFMIRSYVIFPWTWHWKSMISFDFYKKHCVLRSPEDPTCPVLHLTNCSTLCPSPVRQKDKTQGRKSHFGTLTSEVSDHGASSTSTGLGWRRTSWQWTPKAQEGTDLLAARKQGEREK